MNFSATLEAPQAKVNFSLRDRDEGGNYIFYDRCIPPYPPPPLRDIGCRGEGG